MNNSTAKIKYTSELTVYLNANVLPGKGQNSKPKYIKIIIFLKHSKVNINSNNITKN